jgi:uroporphyrinogen decarboxylase
MRRKELTERENYLRAVEFRHPAWIPITVEFVPAIYRKYGAGLQELIRRHPLVFEAGIRDFDSQDPLYEEGRCYTDDWGCLWRNAQGGIIGQVVGHPLRDWAAFGSYRPPNPLEQIDWSRIEKSIAEDRSLGRPIIATPESFSQGGFFDRLQFLRGLENLLIDMVCGEPRLEALIEMVLEYNLKYIRKYLELAPDVMWFHGDIGTQAGLMMSLELFRKYLKPSYTEMFQTCRRAGCHVWYSSDGHVLEAVPDLVECGVSIHDPQVRANTIDGIRKAYKGKLCALVDIDEQMLPVCSPDDISSQVREIVEKVGDRRGGLMIFAAPTADVPLANIEAVCDSWERYCFREWG